MKVTRVDSKGSVLVGELSDGAVFDHYGNVLLKIFNAKLDEDVRAVSVEDGTVYQFKPDVKVIPLDAELIVRGELK